MRDARHGGQDPQQTPPPDAIAGEAADPAPPPSLLCSGIGLRLSIAVAASALLWLVTAWALA
ncbi:MAG: hypothetical protein LBF91_01665 [Azoarcus sp.]|jgi:hypothetical protein|nr:hypothetical protein [Azoarcus sp.]